MTALLIYFDPKKYKDNFGLILALATRKFGDPLSSRSVI